MTIVANEYDKAIDITKSFKLKFGVSYRLIFKQDDFRR
jgi:hypothetical protein